MTRLTGFADGITYTPSMAIARSTTGVIAADSATLLDANIDPTIALNCFGYDTIFVGVTIVAGSSPTATIEPLFRDADAADGARWKRRLVGAAPGVTLGAAASQTTGALASDSDCVEIRVFGEPSVFLRISAVTNSGSTTGLSILVRPGQVRAMPRKR